MYGENKIIGPPKIGSLGENDEEREPTAVDNFISSFRLGNTSQEYFNNLNKLTQHIDVNEVVSDISNNIEEWTVDWTEEDALKFATQFMIYADENDGIDYDKIDFKAYTPEYFKTIYPRFDDNVYEILAEYSNKKLEDNRNNYFKLKMGTFRPFAEQGSTEEPDV